MAGMVTQENENNAALKIRNDNKVAPLVLPNKITPRRSSVELKNANANEEVKSSGSISATRFSS